MSRIPLNRDKFLMDLRSLLLRAPALSNSFEANEQSVIKDYEKWDDDTYRLLSKYKDPTIEFYYSELYEGPIMTEIGGDSEPVSELLDKRSEDFQRKYKTLVELKTEFSSSFNTLKESPKCKIVGGAPAPTKNKIN